MKFRIAILVLVLACMPAAALAIPHATAPVNGLTKDELIPQGTFVRVRMLTPLSSASSHAGDEFSWVVSDDIVVGGRVVVPAGNLGFGRVGYVYPAHGGNQSGYLRLQFFPIALTDGGRIDIGVTKASAVLDENEKNGYGPAADDVANMFIPYFFLFDLRKGQDMVIQKNAVFHVATIEDVFLQPATVAISATPPPPQASPGPTGPSAAPTLQPGATPTPTPVPGTTGTVHRPTPAPSPIPAATPSSK
jgi:hypothetical protein